MKRILLTAILPCAIFFAAAAQYGNEWIDFSKTYYKFKLTEDGVYRIPASTLAAAGLGAIQGSDFRLYRLGSEVAIYTSTDGVFGGGDYIEFVGRRNRGELDRALYEDPDAEQLNPEYSMFTDSAAYFLTWDDSGGGKRLTGIMNDLSNPPAPEPYYMQRDEWVYSSNAVDPRNAPGSDISYAKYQQGEGFASRNDSSFTLDIPTSLIYGQGPNAQLSIRLASSTYTSHDITALFDGDTLLAHGTGGTFKLYQLSKEVAAGNLGANQELNISDAVSNARFAIATIQWTYPRQPDFTGQTFTEFQHEGNGVAQYFEFANFNHGGMDPVVIDLSADVRLTANRNGNTVRFQLPAFSETRDIVVASQANAINTIDKLTPRTFTDYSKDNTEYIIITHPSLRSGADIVGQYAAYRSGAAGGGYHVGIYEITDLTDQFGYGIDKHPEAIRNFNRMIRDHWSAAKMVLIIGKGVQYTRSREHGGLGEQESLVPTFGHPGADHLLFTENGVSLPDLNVGRLPVTDQAQLQIYFSKLKEYDEVDNLPQTLADKGWTKEVLHMGGGEDAAQQDQILGFLNTMADEVTNSEFGADVSTFSKNSTNTIGESNSEQIVQILHKGTSIVKFFGHSSSSALDFQINNPADWLNKGKYPIFSAMGCSAGNIHEDYLSLSERFVFEPDAGTIAFIAGSGPQYQNTLGNWGVEWYDVFGHGVDSMTLGETIHASLSTLNGIFQDVLLVEQETLNGDPALRFHRAPGPDYTWDYESVQSLPENVTINDPSMTLSCDVINIGTNVPDSARVTITQKFPDGHQAQVFSGIEQLSGYRTPLKFVLPVSRYSGGLNTFYFTVDADNTIVELPDPQAEENNTLKDAQGKEGFDVFILDNRALATYPLEFSIVTDQNPELIASETNAFAKAETFVMELDTTAEFDSPLFLREYFTGFRGMLKWKPYFNFVPGTVYYWRVSTEPSQGESYVWDTSSFLYKPGGERGWNQSHYYQYLRDTFDGMTINDQRRFAFLEGVKNVWVQNAVDTGETELFKYFVDNTNNPIFFRDWRSYDAHVFVSVYDPITGKTVKNPAGGAYGAINPFSSQKPVFPFSTATADSRHALMAFLENDIPTGYYVVLHTYQRTGYLDYYPEQWAADSVTYGENLFSVIENIFPDSRIRKLQKGSVPYTLIFRKGGGFVQEQVAPDYNASINVDVNLPVLNTSGNAYSTFAGPASMWSRVEWAYSDKENQDSISLSVYAVRKDNSEMIIADHTIANTVDLSGLDPKEFPYVRLQLNTADPSDNRSAPQLDYWRVLYEGRAEFVYNPASEYEFHSDSLHFGEPLHFSTVVENVSPYPSDAFLVRYRITDKENSVVEILDTVPALAPNDHALIELNVPVRDDSGDHLFLAELNPGGVSPEIHHFNNYGFRTFYVIPDNADPVLDVTFDGRHLNDGDVVSAQPEIVVKLTDDNTFLPITNRNQFTLSLQRPGSFDFETVDLLVTGYFIYSVRSGKRK